jgi:hypothetical protein
MEAKPLGRGLRMSLLVVLLAGCGPAVHGSGDVVEVERETPAFTAVELEDGIAATVVVDPTQPRRVRLVGDDNLVEKLRTEVGPGGDTLHVHFPEDEVGSWHSDNALRAEVTVPELESFIVSGGGIVDLSGTLDAAAFQLDASGASQIWARGLNTDSLNVEASGGSFVTLEGFARKVTSNLSGGSQLHGRKLGTHEAELSCSGGGTVELQVADTLSVDASGGSTFIIIGRPTVRSEELSGGSTLNFY